MTTKQSKIEKYGRVGVLTGGVSAEREISLLSGKCVTDSLVRSGLDIVSIDIDEGFFEQLPKYGLDRALIMLHGPGGEDGVLQGALESYNLPYTGSGVLASAAAMDKLHSKIFWQGSNIRTPAFSLLEKTTNWKKTLEQLGGEIIVKPAREGSSIGMSRVNSAASFKGAWKKALILDHKVIAEQWIEGEEYTVGILDEKALPPIKLETSNDFYDYSAKYLSEETIYKYPCELNENKEKELMRLAIQSFESLGCTGWGRVDVMANAHGEFLVLEVNTVPGMTDHSLMPMAAAAAGYNFDELVLKILDSSM
jgi:D-alanine-D-alanine ligase